MTQELFILPEDKAYAAKRRHELEVEIKALGPEFNDVFTQSSETWHDNAPFEAVRDKQSVLAAELAHIKKSFIPVPCAYQNPKKVQWGTVAS